MLRVFEPDEGRITCIRADRNLVGTSSSIRDIYPKIAHSYTVPPLRKKARSVRLLACKRTRNAFRHYHLFAIKTPYKIRRREWGRGQNIAVAFMTPQDILGTSTRKVVGSNPVHDPWKPNNLDDSLD